ncbi:hypothetical protein IWQ54_006465 [Labrenzia sp. EL_195]|nr:hypothetical protein [Labrenzia sp. EL_195]
MSETRESAKRLKRAFATAIAQFHFVLESEINNEPTLMVIEDPAFIAYAENAHEGIAVNVGTGCVAAVSKLMIAAMQDDEFLVSDGARLTNDLDGLVNASLSWLFLHEIMHAHLGHFETSGQTTFFEAGELDALGLVSIKNSAVARSTILTPEEAAISKCYELQADNDASDVLIDIFSDDRMDDIRMRVAAIFAVMVLIEETDLQRATTSSTHPKSATRFFTLLGHLFQMWIYPHAELETADVGRRLDTGGSMTPEMFEPFAKQVIAPAINDAVILAVAGGAETFLKDMGGAAPLLQDLYTVQWGETLSAETLQTEAGREWLQLMPVNMNLLNTMLKQTPE